MEMSKGTLALLIHGGTENWSPERWKQRFGEVCRDRRVVYEKTGDPSHLEYEKKFQAELRKNLEAVRALVAERAS